MIYGGHFQEKKEEEYLWPQKAIKYNRNSSIASEDMLYIEPTGEAKPRMGLKLVELQSSIGHP